MKLVRVFAVVALILTGIYVPLQVHAGPSAQPVASYRAPILSPIVVTFVRPISTYAEDASIAPGDKVTYTWRKDNQRDCGKFGPMATAPNIATWWHPDAAGGGDCPNEDVHPGIITVTVSDGTWECMAVYPDGSAVGTGPAPQPCTEVTTDTPTATPTETGTPTSTGTATRTSTATSTRTVTATRTTTPTRTITSTPSATDSPTDTVTPTATVSASPSPSPTETPIPPCHPTLKVAPNLVLSTDPKDPFVPFWGLDETGGGWYPDGEVNLTLDDKPGGSVAVDSEGSWSTFDSRTIVELLPGTHRIKGVEGSPGSDRYCFRNATFSTDTPEATKAVADYKQAKNDYYTPWSRRLSRTGDGVAATGAGIALLGTAFDGTIIGIPAGVPMQITGGIIGLVGIGVNRLGNEVGYWASDPPDPAFRQLARVLPAARTEVTAAASTGLPRRVTAALDALTTNMVQQSAAMDAANTSINRAGSAKRANVKACIVFQYQAAVSYARRADALASARPALMRNFIRALNAAGIHSLVIPASLQQRGMKALLAHGFPTAMDAYFHQIYGAAKARTAEAALLKAIHAEPAPTKPVDVLALLRDPQLGAARSLTAFALLSTGFNVQARPSDCTSGR